MNEENKGIIQESFDLLDALYAKEKLGTQITDTTDKLKVDVMTFISERLKDINKKELLTNLLDAELIRKLVMHELTTDQLMNLRTNLSIDKNTSINGVLDLFKPNGTNSSNTLLPPPKEQEEDNDIVKDLSSDQRNAMNKLMLILAEGLQKKDTSKEEGTN
jgi:hypothetical protein